MSDWSLEDVLSELHADVASRLERIRKTIGHPGSKGDSSEDAWIKLLTDYLPKRYEAAKAFVVDSNGKFSQQIDVLIYDRQYSPFVFNYEGNKIIPAESVYAVFEAKQELNKTHVEYAQEKIGSVRKLHRTSLPVPHAGGTFPPKKPAHIIGGILTVSSGWSPALGAPLEASLACDTGDGLLDMGCVATAGYFYKNHIKNEDGEGKDTPYNVIEHPHAATAFLLKLISMLQAKATVPLLDVEAYAKWLPDISTPP